MILDVRVRISVPFSNEEKFRDGIAPLVIQSAVVEVRNFKTFKKGLTHITAVTTFLCVCCRQECRLCPRSSSQYDGPLPHAGGSPSAFILKTRSYLLSMLHRTGLPHPVTDLSTLWDDTTQQGHCIGTCRFRVELGVAVLACMRAFQMLLLLWALRNAVAILLAGYGHWCS